MDLWHKITKWLDYNRGIAIAVIMSLAVCIPLITGGCKPTVIIDGTEYTSVTLPVKGEEILNRHKTEVAAYEAAGVELAGKEEAQKELFEVLGSTGTSLIAGTVNPAAIPATIVQLVTLAAAAGFGFDSRRRGKLLNKKK